MSQLLRLLKKAKNSIFSMMLAAFFVLYLGNFTSHPQTVSDFDSEKSTQMVTTIENTWEGAYENYFGEDFVNLSLTSSQIADKLSQMSQETGTKPAVIWALPQPESLKLLLITSKNKPQGWSITAANQETLVQVVEQFHREITDTFQVAIGSTSYLSSAQLLYQWIISPLELTLETENIDTLILCVGPGLRSLPFPALHDGERFLIEKYSYTRIPAFNLTDISYSDLRDAQVLAMGASEFTNHPPLPGVEVELQTIIPQPWEGVAILNEGFTVENLIEQRKKEGFEIVHLATHAEFLPGNPSNSYIQFADTQLSLAEINQLNWSNPRVELLVLSACKTALGNVQAELGFAGVALQSGVKSVLASLWAVSDAGTVPLMSEFYQHLKTASTKAEALKLAQLAMLKQQVRLEEGELQNSRDSVSLPLKLPNQQKLSHPYYWAGFSLIGSPW